MIPIDRDSEFSALRDLLRDGLSGMGNAAVVSSAIGLGKTALLNAFADYAAKSGAEVLSSVGSRTERKIPFAVLEQIFRGTDLQTMLPTKVDEMTSGWLRELWRAVDALAQEKPVVILVDDAHYADIESLQCLLYLIKRLKSASVLVILSECTDLCSVNRSIIGEFGRALGRQKITLTPLSRESVGNLLIQRLGGCDLDEISSQVYDVSGGSPLLVNALMEDIRTVGEFAVGSEFANAILSCLGRYESVVVDVVYAFAILGDFATPALLVRTLECNSLVVEKTIGRLNSAGLIEAAQFRHESVRSVVLDDMDSASRAAMHSRAARALYDSGATAEVLAGHLLLAGGLKEPWVVPVLRDAAEHLLRRGDADRAIDYLQLAYSTSENEFDRAALSVTLAEAEWRLDPAKTTRRLSVLVDAVENGQLSACRAAKLLGLLLWRGRVNDAKKVIDYLVKESRKPGMRASKELLACRSHLSYSYPGLSSRIPATEDGGLVGDRGASSSFRKSSSDSLMRVLSQGGDAGALSEAEYVLESSFLDDATASTIVVSLLALIFGGRPNRAAMWCDALLQGAASPVGPTTQALLSATQSVAHVRLGRYFQAYEYANSALANMPARSWGVAVGVPIASAVLAATAMGQYVDAERRLVIPVPEAMFETPCGLLYLQARGRFHHALGRFRAALSDFQKCGQLMRLWKMDQAALASWRIDAAQAYLGLGERDKAKQLVDEGLILIGPESAALRGAALRVLANSCDSSKRVHMLREAMDELELSDNDAELATVLVDLSLAHLERGEDKIATLTASRAYHLAHVSGATALTSRLPTKITLGLSREDSGNHAEDDRVGSLSQTELRVATLAASGYTNRQISKRLYITISTVEQHLTRVYRKLKVKHRFDLPSVLHLISARSAS